jgi:nucleotide-binding universal stress UspA family protein
MTQPVARIVVPLDGSKNAENALPAAAFLARLYGAPVLLVHVVEDGEHLDGEAGLKRAQAAFKSYAVALAKRFGADVNGVSAELRTGSAAAEIAGAAAGGRCIVIASHGRGGFKAAFIGSVADKVIRTARIPVLVVPGVGGPAQFDKRPVLVALDGEPEAERALGLAREIAAKAGAPVTLLRAVGLPPPVGIEFSYYPPDLLTSLEAVGNEYLQKVGRAGETTILVHGAASMAIVQAADEIDAGLVAMASGGKGLIERIAIGSTTGRVMHSLHRPLLVVPPPPGD